VVGMNFGFALSLNVRGDIVGGYVDGSNASRGFLSAKIVGNGRFRDLAPS
jgi:hypothetical protein